MALVSAVGCSNSTDVKTVDTTPVCSASAPNGTCSVAGQVCFEGACVAQATLCSDSNPTGVCKANHSCFAGGCVQTAALCSSTNSTGYCATGSTCLAGACVATTSLCSNDNPTGSCPSGQACTAEGFCTTTEWAGISGCDVNVYAGQPIIAVRTGPLVTATSTARMNAVVAGNTFSVGGWPAQDGGVSFAAVPATVFTAVASGTPTDVQFLVGADDTATAANLAAAINANASAGALVDASAASSVVTLTAKAAGVLGNGIAVAGSPSARFTISGPTGSAVYGSGTGKGTVTVDGLTFRDASGDGQLQPYEDWRKNELCRAKDLAARLTKVEKIGLLKSGIIGSVPNAAAGSTYLATNAVASLRDARYRQGMHDTRGGTQPAPAVWATWSNNMQEFAEADTWGIPILYISDPWQTGGSTTSWFTPTTGTLGLGAINDVAITRQVGELIRDEFKAVGIRMEYGPMADIATEPRWTRVAGTFGENGLAVANHVRALISGFQGGAKPDFRNNIMAMVKHFPGHGAEYKGYDYHSSGDPKRMSRWCVFPGNNFEYLWIPFQAAFDVGAGGVMPCYCIYTKQYAWDAEQVAAGFSYGMMTRLAKQRMGFTGFVSGDWGTLSNAWGQETLTEAQRSAAWFNAGSHQWGDNLQGTYTALDTGLVTDEQINFAAAKVLEAYVKLGLFENPYIDPAIATATLRKNEFRQLGFDTMKKAMVILANLEHSATQTCNPFGCTSSGASFLPISGSRKTGSAYTLDPNNDGTVSVYYQGSTQALNGSDYMDAIAGAYDYRSPLTFDAATSTTTLGIEFTNDLTRADIWVYRFQSSIQGYDTAQTSARNRIIDALRVRDGYTKFDGTVVPATNPTLKIVAVINIQNAPIIKWLVNGLVSLDEPSAPSAPATTTYPSVDEPSLAVTTNVRTTTGKGVDAIVAEFGATDRAVLDVLFKKNLPAGTTRYGNSVFPLEIPSSVAAVNAQYEDLPADSISPTFQIGFPSLGY